MRLDCKGEVTVTSKAAGWPAFHTGKKISPRLELLLGIKLFCSQMGDKRAADHADIIFSRIRSWQEIISPRPWHDSAWSPITSRIPDLQKGQFLSLSYNFKPSQYLRATRNSLEDRCSPRAGMGAADNQAPVCGWERECKRAFSLMELCFPNKLSKAELSSSSWIFLWEGYVIATSLISSTALTNETSSVGLWPVNFSTGTEGWKTGATYAAWTWSADRLIPTPVLLIGRHAWSQEVSDNTIPIIPSKVARWFESNFRRILFGSSEGELHRNEWIILGAPSRNRKIPRAHWGSSTYAKLYRRSSNFLTHLSKQEETKASDPIAAPKISIPFTQFLLIKLSTFFMPSIDHSSHLSFLSSKPNSSPDSERISNALQSSISVPAIIPSSRYQKCCERFGICFRFRQ